MMGTNEAIILEFPLSEDDFDTAGEASSRINQALKRVGVRPEVIRRVAVSAYEAAMNVVIHAYRGMIQASIFTDRTELLVLDEGPGIADIKMAMRQGYSTASDEAREAGFGAGMGLNNIMRHPDECTIESVVGVGTAIHIIVRH